MRLRRWFTREKEEETGEQQQQQQQQQEVEVVETNKLKVAYTNVDGLLSSILQIKDYLSSEKPVHDKNKIEGRD